VIETRSKTSYWRARAEKAEAEISACHKERVWALNQMTGAQMECGRLRAELARLTTLRPASEHDGRTSVLIWDEAFDGGWFASCVGLDVPHYSMWTPLPEPKKAKK
jgi:hypothetical protein